MRIYEINTLVWLVELSERYEQEITLANVPEHEWDVLKAYHFNAVWLMGVWKRSPRGRALAKEHADVVDECRRVYPGFSKNRDIVGSPYCIFDYVVDEKFGGPQGLAIARESLRERNLQLLLDFVPNHTAHDHHWVTEHPEYYVTGTPRDISNNPRRFFKTDANNIIAYGSPSVDTAEAWTDTAQVNFFNQDYRNAVIATLRDIGNQCDGIRCDMSMLALDDAFASIWTPLVGTPLAQPFWTEVIKQTRITHPDIIFIAESYSDTQWQLQQQGFNYCYDKERLYDRLRCGSAESIRQHLFGSPPEYLKGLLHFIENHDEPPASLIFRPKERLILAAIATATLPGASLWYDQQFEERFGKLPVQLGSATTMRNFYRRLLKVTYHESISYGDWVMCQVDKAPAMIAWCWTYDNKRLLVVINVSEDERHWGHITTPWHDLQGHDWQLYNLLTEEYFNAESAHEGKFYIEPRRWGADIFELLQR
ncbi:MAG: alpha-amylase [Deltaproteobacteria bacterium]|nr:alpha-amylase [Deltaproteobacteria bacterium]